MIVLDASVMIAALDRTDAHFRRAKAILRSAGRERLVAHRITLAEVLVRPAGAGKDDAVASALDAMGVGRLDEPDDPRVLAQLRARHGLKMPDCCVLHAALRDGARLATFDERLAGAARAEGVAVVRRAGD
ncbi:type II toxin-antitoxin system VapC family toxin [Galbitalea sp. SE-J8]|uniref:type II toxin-antitoxin system VapC family toxin n=1 Tax=Galbitalea sp. SE-J8 TaxID=3054952 RepID=UPI00259CC6F3|nr:type II toxin-antitoxin system VapC family toxin [Galbitalea sp. SE-J8]MDM4762466.1 type II toxin-antitoxin system VapC family toxin [Galbitalea sp. SE-J8]